MKNQHMRRFFAAAAALLFLSLFAACVKPLTELTAEELLELGEKYLLELDYGQTEVLFTRLIEVEPKMARGYTGLAAACIGQGDYDGAVAVLQNGAGQLSDGGFLRDAAELFEQVLEKSPANPGAYIGLAELYVKLGETDKAVELLQRGLLQIPGDGRIEALLAELSPFEMVTVYDEVFMAQNGEQQAELKLVRPVFRKGFAYADRFNAEISAEVGEYTTPMDADEVRALYADYFEMSEESARPSGEYWPGGYGYGYGGFYFMEIAEVSYNDGIFVSFRVNLSGIHPGAPHGWNEVSGKTFNLKTGEVLDLSDILFVDAATVREVLPGEFISQHGDDPPPGGWDEWYSELQDTSTLEMPFVLADDGVHIYYHQYTIDYAYGGREVFIPYSRADLVRPPFARAG